MRGGGYVHLENRHAGLNARNQGCQAVSDETPVELVDGTGNCAQWQLIPVSQARLASGTGKELPTSLAVESARIMIYPNPSTGQVIVSGLSKEIRQVEIYNLMGVRLQEVVVQEGKAVLDLSDQPKGMLVIRAGQMSYKIVKE